MLPQYFDARQQKFDFFNPDGFKVDRTVPAKWELDFIFSKRDSHLTVPTLFTWTKQEKFLFPFVHMHENAQCDRQNFMVVLIYVFR